MTITQSATQAISGYNLPLIRDELTNGEQARINSFCSGASIFNYYTSLLPGTKTPELHAFKNVSVNLQDEPFSYETESQAALYDTIVQRDSRGPSRLSAPLVVSLEQLLMKLEVNVFGQIQSSTDCGAAMRVDTISGSLLLNRPEAERSSFHISLKLCTGSRLKLLMYKRSIFLYSELKMC